MKGKKKILALKQDISRKRFLIPNLVTAGNLFCGYLSILYSTSGRFEKSIYAILFAILLDGLDGRVARKLNASTKFGVEFDSFGDILSFGIAPGVLYYCWAFQQPADEFGVFITFLYVLAVVVRLTRFNIKEKSLSVFEGLPSPAGAAAVVSLIFLHTEMVASGFTVPPLALYLIAVSILMVSQVPYQSVKHIDVNALPKRVLLALFMLIPFSWYQFHLSFFCIAHLFLISGPFLWVMSKAKSAMPDKKMQSQS